MKKPVTRRDFVRGTVGSALGAVGTIAFLRSSARAGEASPEEDPGPSVVVVRDADVYFKGRKVDPERIKVMLDMLIVQVTGAASAAEGWASLFRPDDLVGLVTNDYMNKTHPELIDAVTEALVGAGIRRDRIVDAQGNDQTVKTCTALICLPALKAHWLTGIGTVIKNYIMFSGKPSHYHKESSSKLGEIWLLPHVRGKTRLVLVDAIRPMASKGPQPDPRYKWDYKGLIGGTDPVAVETVCLRVINNKRTAIRGEPWPLSPPPICIEAADTQYGLGVSDFARIQLDTHGWADDLLLP